MVTNSEERYLDTDYGIISYKNGYGVYNCDSLRMDSEQWFREMFAPGAADVVVTQRYYWIRKYDGCVFSCARDSWMFTLHVPDETVNVYIIEAENIEHLTYIRRYAITYKEASDIMYAIEKGELL